MRRPALPELPTLGQGLLRDGTPQGLFQTPLGTCTAERGAERGRANTHLQHTHPGYASKTRLPTHTSNTCLQHTSSTHLQHTPPTHTSNTHLQLSLVCTCTNHSQLLCCSADLSCSTLDRPSPAVKEAVLTGGQSGAAGQPPLTALV